MTLYIKIGLNSNSLISTTVYVKLCVSLITLNAVFLVCVYVHTSNLLSIVDISSIPSIGLVHDYDWKADVIADATNPRTANSPTRLAVLRLREFV